MLAVDRKKIWYGIGIGLGVYAGMRYLLPVAVPFLLGWMLASLVLPAARWMERKWKIRRGIGGGLLILTVTVAAALLLWKSGELLVAQIQGLLGGMSDLGEKAGGFLDSCCVVLEDVTGIAAEKSRNFLIYQAGLLAEQLQNRLGPACLGYLLTLVKGIVALGGGVLVVILFGTLVLKDMEQFRKKIRKSEAGKSIVRVAEGICQAGGRYLKAQLAIMMLVAAVCAAGFWILGNPYFLVAGFVVGLLDALPLIGTGTILVPWALIWCLQGEYMVGLGYFLLYLAADLLRQFLEPRLLGQQIGLHPAVMLISIYGGFFLYGLPGFFLGPFSVLVFQNIMKEVEAYLEKKETVKE